MNKFLLPTFRGIFDNAIVTDDNTALIPALWARESLVQLEKEMITPMLVYREFEDAIAEFGDTVNAWRPQEMIAQNRRDKQRVKTSDSKTTKVPVKLNQWIHQSFLLGDAESGMAFVDLIDVHVIPAARSIADKIDQITTVQLYQFMENSVGRLGQAQSKSTMIQARKTLNDFGVSKRDRTYLIGTQAEADLLNISEFLTADKIGDDGTALREGSLGQKLGFNIFMNQNVPSVTDIPAADKVSAVVDNVAGYAVGTTTLAVDAVSTATLTVGMWCVIDGDDTPQRITASTVTANAGDITISPGLKSAVVDDSVVAIYKPAQVNQPSSSLEDTGYAPGYPAGYAEEITIDGLSDKPGLGRLATVGNGAVPNQTFGLVGRNTANVIDLDTPLDGDLAEDSNIFLGPEGEYSFAFHRNCLALVTRPLPAPVAPNVASFSASYNGIAMRATIVYDGDYMATRVNLDVLCGVKVLDERMGCVIYSN
jgi:hypothetical protein